MTGTDYLRHKEAAVVLRDGSTVGARPVRPGDGQKLVSFYQGLTSESLRRRFFAEPLDIESFVEKETTLDYVRDFGIIATVGDAERVVGHASYHLLRSVAAQVTFVIADDYQGRGLSTILLGQLAAVAAANGIETCEAVLQPDNLQMLEVLRESGFSTEITPAPGLLRVTFPTSLTSVAAERFLQREQTAAINAIKTFLRPRSIAVVGASRERRSVGGQLFHNLLEYGFNGPVYPVNAGAAVVQSVTAFSSVEEVPGPVDLAFIVVPATHVVEVAGACGRKGVRAIVVVSAGFGEAGEEGRARQAELLSVCRTWGMRLIGPNCLGIASSYPDVRMNGLFSPVMPPPGSVAFASQSGALGLATVDFAAAWGLGISSFVSMGNKADISSNDLLSYWEVDPATSVILLHLESFGNPRKFSQIARRVGRTKPIVVVKSGRSSAGVRAASSHTGALLAASDLTVDALFERAGVIRTDTLQELFDVASLLSHQPLPQGKRVGIVTNAGGPGILCADTCEAEGLEVPILSEESQARLRTCLPAGAGISNPVDVIATATAEQFGLAVSAVLDDPKVDALIAIFIPALLTRPEDIAEAIVDAAGGQSGHKPVLAVFMTAAESPEALRRTPLRIPSYRFPEAAATALAHVCQYSEWRSKPAGRLPEFADIRAEAAGALVATALGRGGGWLNPEEVAALLSCYGLPVLDQRLVSTPEEAGAAARGFGAPVALKCIGPELVHKTELGAVRLGLRGQRSVSRAAREMKKRLEQTGKAVVGFLVQPMVEAGAEMIVGIVHDPHFGPLIACGAGGVLVELMGDVSVRLAPLSVEDARDMVTQLKTYPLLTGYRGRPSVDVAALEDVLLRVSTLARDLPQVAEVDCNPVKVLERGAVIIDARIRVAETPLPPADGGNPSVAAPDRSRSGLPPLVDPATHVA